LRFLSFGEKRDHSHFRPLSRVCRFLTQVYKAQPVTEKPLPPDGNGLIA